MENLNAEQIIKALECCYSDDLSCIDCPYQDTAKYKECGNLNKNALALIKELTEENERLKAENIDCRLGFRLLEDAFKRLETINSELENETLCKFKEWLINRVKGLYINENELLLILNEYTQIQEVT